MSDQPGPALRKRHLAAELTALRLAKDLSHTEVAAAIRRSRSLIGHYEAGSRVPAYTDLKALLELYGATHRLAELDELRELANQRGWYDTAGLPQWARVAIGLEADATLVRCFALEVVPSLLQNMDYAREILRRHHSGEADLQRDVSARMRRQERIGRGLDVTVVASQALVERTACAGQVGLAQIRWLRDAVRTPGITLQVLPFAAGLHRAGSGSFTVFEFGSDYPPVGYVMYALGGHLVDDPGVVTGLQDLYRELQELALDSAGTEAFLAEVINRVEGT